MKLLKIDKIFPEKQMKLILVDADYDMAEEYKEELIYLIFLLTLHWTLISALFS